MRIYLDHAATTPLLPDVQVAMEPWLGAVANPSSLHFEGRMSRMAVDSARQVVAESLNCLFGEIVFTSGGTEAANLAILGAALGNEDSARKRILFSAAEHHCVLHTQPVLQRLGFSVELIPVDREARVNPTVLETMLGTDVLLVSVMHANNELGSMNSVAELSELSHRVGALFHCDAVQAYPWCGTVDELGVDLLTTSAHKFYGPKGSGALYMRSGVPFKPVMVGGGQERDVRAGTENVAGIVGFAEAVRWNLEHRELFRNKYEARDTLRSRLVAKGFVSTLASDTPQLSGHFHCRYPGIEADTLLIRFDRAGVSASSGAACSSGSLEPSHVLAACGYSEAESKEGLRFTFGKDNTIDQANEAADRILSCLDAVLNGRP